MVLVKPPPSNLASLELFSNDTSFYEEYTRLRELTH